MFLKLSTHLDLNRTSLVELRCLLVKLFLQGLQLILASVERLS